MTSLVLHATTSEGTPIEAHFLPEKGMNLARFRWGEHDLIDLSTQPLFEERFAGLGALIGPHFHHRKPASIPPVPHEERFPHIARIKAKGITEPFSHGIGRYAPWKAEASDTTVTATLKGSDEWEGVPLQELEGQDFTMQYDATLTPKGLQISLSVVSETDSIVGLHTYWSLPSGENRVVADVQEANGKLDYLVGPAIDATFHAAPDPTVGSIQLITKPYTLKIDYHAPSQENAFQLYRPEEASYICIEPVSARDPRHPNLTVSQITAHFSLEEA